MDLAKEIMVYLLLYQIIMNLVQNTSYQKYVGIFLGTILICIIAAPILKLIKMENIWNVQYEKNEYQFNKQEAETWLNAVEEMQGEIILEEYREKVKKQIENKLLENELETEQIEIEIEEQNLQIKKIEIQLKNSVETDWSREEQVNTASEGIAQELEKNVGEKWNVDKVKAEIIEIYQLTEENVIITS